MNRKANRIYFLDNPYPQGHQLKEFVWSGRLDKNHDLWFNFHLKTENYDAEDDSDDKEEPKSDWMAKGAWKNCRSCTLSSTFGHLGGIKIDCEKEKFDFESLHDSTLIADPLPLADDFELDDLAFHIYLLGHDSAADHSIKFSRQTNNKFDLEWTGKIALTYVGNYDFKHEFIALIENVEFDGFYFPKGMTNETAQNIFSKKLANIENYEFVDLNPKSFKREYKLKPKLSGV